YEFTCRCSDDGGASWNFATLPMGNGRLTVNTALAVDLLSFNAEPSNDEIYLNWSTAIEQNHSHFDVERSADSYNWERIGQIEGQGNSISRQDYFFEDKAPLKGRNYYRLNQIDFNGQSSLSKVLVVENGSSQQWTIAPNPVSQQLYVQANAQDDFRPTTYLIRLFDGKGILLRSLQQEGIGHVEMDLADLQSGLYLLTITDVNGHRLLVSERILKK
ncbi:MAG: T9SS type A sorting domain-containing protein, partial [Bacteroidota bacterium]